MQAKQIEQDRRAISETEKSLTDTWPEFKEFEDSIKTALVISRILTDEFGSNVLKFPALVIHKSSKAMGMLMSISESNANLDYQGDLRTVPLNEVFFGGAFTGARHKVLNSSSSAAHILGELRATIQADVDAGL